MPPLFPRVRGAAAHLGARAEYLRPVRWSGSPAPRCHPVHPEGWGLACDRLPVRGPKESPEQRVRREILGRIRGEVWHGLGLIVLSRILPPVEFLFRWIFGDLQRVEGLRQIAEGLRQIAEGLRQIVEGLCQARALVYFSYLQGGRSCLPLEVAEGRSEPVTLA